MDAIWELLSDASVRAIIIAIAVGFILQAMRIKSPAVAHRVWAGVLLIMLFLPVVSLWAPKITIPLLPSTPIHHEAQVHSIEILNSAAIGRVSAWNKDRAKPSISSNLPAPVIAIKQPVAKSIIYRILLSIYFMGFLFFLIRLLTGMLLFYKFTRNAQWNDRNFYYSKCTIPLTVGLFHTRILLPLDSKHWSAEKLYAVLAHEEEHKRRHDPLVAWLALLNRCIYWFHPLAWWLCGKMTELAEQACDESVLAKGYDAGAYAEHLLEFARSIRQKGALVAVWGSPFHGSKLALRTRRILILGRTPAISRVRLIAVSALCAFATLAPALGELARSHAAPQRSSQRSSTASSDQNGNLHQPIRARVQAASIDPPILPNEQERTTSPEDAAPPDDTISGTGLHVALPPPTLFERGSDHLKKGQYIKSRPAFQTLIQTYADSDMAAEAHFGNKLDIAEDLAIGDLKVAQFYAEKSNYAAAMSRLKKIIDNYPGFSRIDEVKRLYEAPQIYLMRLKEALDQLLKQNLEGYKLVDLQLKGSILFDPEKLKSALLIKNGDPFDSQLIKKGMEQIQQLYFNLGYIDFTYTPKIDANHNEKTVSCSILLVQGEQYFVRKIYVYGVSHDEDSKEIISTLRAAGLEEKTVVCPMLLDKAVISLNELLNAKNLILKDYEFKRSSEGPGSGDINIRLQPKDH
jgi:beta-lactamase regulating signal transducer with metallopeptidase domain